MVLPSLSQHPLLQQTAVHAALLLDGMQLYCIASTAAHSVVDPRWMTLGPFPTGCRLPAPELAGMPQALRLAEAQACVDAVGQSLHSVALGDVNMSTFFHRHGTTSFVLHSTGMLLMPAARRAQPRVAATPRAAACLAS